MLIEGIMRIIYSVFSLLTILIKIPPLNDDINNILDNIFSYITSGISIIGNYINLDLAFTLLGIVIAIDVGIAIYHFVMWVLKKIPMLGIE